MRTRMLTRALPLSIALFSALTHISTAAPPKRKDGNPSSRSIRVMNESGVTIDLFWVHVVTGELAASHTEGDGVAYGGETGISSYVGHTFEVKELPSKRTGQCRADVCRSVHFTCSENEDQIVTIHKDFTVSLSDNRSRAMDTAQTALSSCQLPEGTQSVSVSEQLDALSQCLEAKADLEIQKNQNEISFQVNVRKEMGSKLQKYSCETEKYASVNVTTTPSLVNSTYHDNIQVELLFESDYSSIQLFRNFLTPPQCQRVLKQTSNVSHTFTKSKQPDFEMDVVVSKLQELAQGTLQLSPTYYSREVDHDIVVSVDHGRSGTCHADGTCGRHVQDGDHIRGRVLVFCTSGNEELPVRGGVVFFPHAGIRIVPQNGQAVLIVYEGARGVRDNDPFVNQHTICPVLSGSVVTLDDVYAGT